MLSTPFCLHIIHYDPPRGFLVPKFSTYDGSSDPFDHIIHYRQLMTLDIGNDALLWKVFPASLQGQTLSWFHHLPPNFVDNFRDLSKAFVGQYLCSAQHKQNISTLQNIKMQENESLREFVKRFGQVVLQVEAYNMDVVLQIFKRSICPGSGIDKLVWISNGSRVLPEMHEYGTRCCGNISSGGSRFRTRSIAVWTEDSPLKILVRLWCL
ncbi:hypothetical protein VitviT2T_029678 [Vitis vinifera]|uniref:Retrotransposon gag domain-containing protein n=1 Tax=Vitis vinifera TaxID=29760 RepID=A0ABY9DYU0_VITVI|nr:hypothetical protein VitviT2T_029678 [Vitis vinifera]